MLTRFVNVVVAVCLAVVGVASGQTWNGLAGTDWFTAANWTPATVPGPGATVTINSGTVNVPSDVSVGTLTLNGGGTIQGSGNLTITGTLNWTSGTMQGAGQLIIASGATASLTGFALKNVFRSVVNNGTWNWLGNGSADYSNTVFTNNGVFNADPAALVQQSRGQNGSTGSINAFNNTATGVFNKAGSGTTRFTTSNSGVPFNNAGTVNVTAGTLELLTGGSDAAGYVVQAGTTLTFGGGRTVSVAPLLSGTGTVNLNNGMYVFDAAQTVENQLNVAGTLVLNVNQTMSQLTLNGGVIQGSGNLTVTGTLNWPSGTMQGAGQLIIASGATANLTGFSDKNVYRAVANNGTWNWLGTGSMRFSNTVFTNNGVFNADPATGTQSCFGDNGSFGSINKFANGATGVVNKVGNGTTRFGFGVSGVPVNNAGAVNLLTGALEINSNGTISGGSLTGGLLRVASVLTFTGPAVCTSEVALTSGSVVLEFDQTFRAINLNGGVIQGAGNLTVTGALNWLGGTMEGGGQLVIASGATVNLSGFNDKNVYRAVVNNGTWNWLGTGSMRLSNTVFTNNGVFNADPATGTQSCFGDNGSAGSINAFNNTATGVFNKVASGTTRFGFGNSGVPFNNAGTLNLTTGRLEINAGGTFSGGSLTGGSTTPPGTGGVLRVASTLTFTGPVACSANVTLASGSLAGAGNLTCTGMTFRYDGGTISGTPTFVSCTIFDNVTTAYTFNLRGACTFVGALTANQRLVMVGTGTQPASLTVPDNFTFTGEISLITPDFDQTASAVLLASGTLTNSGSLSVGPRSVVQVTGNFVQTSGGRLTVITDGTGGSGIGRVTATGSMSLAGTVSLGYTGAFTLNSCLGTFDFLNAGGAINGGFSTFNQPAGPIGQVLRLVTQPGTGQATLGRLEIRNVADIVSIGGTPPGDGLLTGDDFVSFINAFAAQDLLADVVAIGGIPSPPDGLLTGDDFIAFINAFAAGCQ